MEKGDRFEVKIFFFLLEIIMVLGGKYGKWRSIRSEDLFLEIIMIFGEKLQSAPNFKYPPLIGVAQNFIFQNGVAEQKSLRSPEIICILIVVTIAF